MSETMVAPKPVPFGKLPVGAIFAFNPQDIGDAFGRTPQDAGSRHEYEKIAAGKVRNRYSGRMFRQRANYGNYMLDYLTA